MNFREKKTAYGKMQGKQYFAADQALLKSKKPEDRFATMKVVGDKAFEKIQREILWTLLAIFSVEEIKTNRKNFGAGSKESHSDQAIGEQNKSRDEQIAALKAFDLSDPKCDFEKVQAFYKFFELKSAGKKKADKIAALKKFVKALPKDEPVLTKEELFESSIELLKKLDFSKGVGIECLASLCSGLNIDIDKTDVAAMGLTLENYRENNIPKTPEEIRVVQIGLFLKLILDDTTPIEILEVHCEIFEIDVDRKNKIAMLDALKNYRETLIFGAKKEKIDMLNKFDLNSKPTEISEEMKALAEFLEIVITEETTPELLMEEFKSVQLELAEKNEELEDENDDLKNENTDLKDENKELQDKVEETEEENQELQEKAEETEEENQELQDKVEDLETQKKSGNPDPKNEQNNKNTQT